jgi:hypothetical protein
MLAVLAGIGMELSACSWRTTDTESHMPGFGEIMASIETRHAKLWFAGQAGNWPLAAYEIDELREGLEDVGTLHPTHKTVPTSVPRLIAEMMERPLDELEKAVKAQDRVSFEKNFDGLTAACNACHQVSKFGFLGVTRPSFNPFPNQDFSAGR